MNTALDIAIIGGGLIGLSTADSLTHRGAQVTIFEKHSEVGHGAGRYNSGMIHPSQAAPWFFDDTDQHLTQKIFRWANNSRDLLMKRREMLGCEDSNRSPGTVQLFDSQYIGQNARDFYRELGVECREYRGDWCFGYYGLEFPADQSGDAFLYGQKLAKNLAQKGCKFQTGVPAKLVRQGKNVYIKSGNQLRSFDQIVVAAGAASPKILEPLGYDLPVKPLKGHALVFGRPDFTLPRKPIMHWASRSALTVFEDHVRLSGTVDEDDPKALLEIWEEIAPETVTALGTPIVEWSGDRPHSEIGSPIIGPTSIPNVWVNAGHGHMGWSLCTWSGEMLARTIMDGQFTEDSKPGSGSESDPYLFVSIAEFLEFLL